MAKKLRRLLPHAAIVICNMYIVFFLIDRVNMSMNFIDNGLTKGLFLALSLMTIWLVLPEALGLKARRPARPAQPVRRDYDPAVRRVPAGESATRRYERPAASPQRATAPRRTDAGRFGDYGSYGTAGRNATRAPRPSYERSAYERRSYERSSYGRSSAPRSGYERSSYARTDRTAPRSTASRGTSRYTGNAYRETDRYDVRERRTRPEADR